jgi:hypothetical protein
MTEKVFSPGEVLTAADVNNYLLNRTGSGNAIINGAFEINQRGFTSTTAGGYGFDRWLTSIVGGTVTYSSQAFTPGTAPEAGYEASNFARIVTSGQSAADDFAILRQFIEGVRTFANQTVTVSFWARAGSGTPGIYVDLSQVFGSGGSEALNIFAGQATLNTTFTRYSFTVNVPTISGKTIGPNDHLRVNFFLSAGSNIRASALGIQNNTFDIWGVQVEAGSVATPFRRNANSLQGELAACQRYYEVTGGGSSGRADSASVVELGITFKVSKRTTPTMSIVSTTPKVYQPTVGTKTGTGSTLSAPITPTTTGAIVGVTGFSGLTTGAFVFTHDTDFVIASSEL